MSAVRRQAVTHLNVFLHRCLNRGGVTAMHPYKEKGVTHGKVWDSKTVLFVTANPLLAQPFLTCVSLIPNNPHRLHSWSFLYPGWILPVGFLSMHLCVNMCVIDFAAIMCVCVLTAAFMREHVC